MTPDELDAIEARVRAAQPGPWTRYSPHDHANLYSSNGELVAGVYDWDVGGIEHEADSIFIAHAREDVPALLAEVRRLRAVIERVAELAEDWRYKGEHGWDDGSHAYGPSPDGELLDNVSRDLLRALDAAAPGTTTPAG